MKKNKIFYAEKKGLTLIEILVAIAISIVIIAASYEVYNISYKSYKKNYAMAELSQNARIALERMSRDVRQTMEILTDLPENPDVGTPPSAIKFQDGHSYWADGRIQYLTYYLSGTNLNRKISHFTFTTPCETAPPSTWVLFSARDALEQPPAECDNEDTPRAEKITNLQFWGTSVVTINLTVSDGTTTYNYQTKALGRNVQ